MSQSVLSLAFSGLPFTLKTGDAVALVAPASGQKHNEHSLIDDAVSLLKQWGLSVIITPTLSDKTRYLSASDHQRTQDLSQALTHPDIKAIFVTRGGYGCARLLPYLQTVAPPTPRLLLGFSDITTLHLQFADTPRLYSVHAPNLATRQLLGDSHHAENNRNALYQLLFNNHKPTLQLQHLQGKNTAGWQEKPCIGGCLSLLVTSLGTSHEIETAGKILLLEEVGESPYKIDRMLTHLKNARKFEAPAAMIIGELADCHTPTINVGEILSEFFAKADFPVFTTNDFGHGNRNIAWVYGNANH